MTAAAVLELCRELAIPLRPLRGADPVEVVTSLCVVMVRWWG